MDDSERIDIEILAEKIYIREITAQYPDATSPPDPLRTARYAFETASAFIKVRNKWFRAQ